MTQTEKWAAGSHTSDPMTHPHSTSENPGKELQTVFASVTVAAEPGAVLNTIIADHDRCGRRHVHKSRTLGPFVRRPHCGGPKYRVVPVTVDVPYGRDYDDTGHWADRDGTVYDEYGNVVKPAPVRSLIRHPYPDANPEAAA